MPPDWVHPKDDRGRFEPLFPGAFGNPEQNKNEDPEDRVDPDGCMPEWPDGVATHFMMYEDTTEGTPISPAFATPEALASWLVANKASAFAGQTATYEGWLRVARGGFAPSATMTIGDGGIRNVRSGVDGYDERADE